MAKLRHNHKSNKNFGGNAVRIVILLIFVVALLITLPFYLSKMDFDSSDKHLTSKKAKSSASKNDHSNQLTNDIALPTGDNGEIVQHTYFTLSYNEDKEQANWVAYTLTKESLVIPNVERTDWFSEDKKVSTKSAHYKDYKGSGYTKGHMVPAGDMAFNRQAMEETFFMSNMSPQTRGFNGGIWRELEECVRDWAYKNEQVYVVSGPIYRKSKKEIGRAKVDVPDFYYKVILDIEGNTKKGIGFIIPHETLDLPLEKYAVTIDEVEKQTGYDFFKKMDVDINSLEANMDIDQWAISKERFRKRVKSWNNS